MLRGGEALVPGLQHRRRGHEDGGVPNQPFWHGVHFPGSIAECMFADSGTETKGAAILWNGAMRHGNSFGQRRHGLSVRAGLPGSSWHPVWGYDAVSHNVAVSSRPDAE
jgi:hypothetical protein